MRAALFTAAILSLALPAGALAKQKVQITDVKGSIAFMVEGAIKNALKKQKSVELVTGGEAVQITAVTERAGKGWGAEISVQSGGKVLKTWRVQAKEIRKLSQAIEKKLWKQLGPTISKATPVEMIEDDDEDTGGDEGGGFEEDGEAPVKGKGGEVTKAPAVKEPPKSTGTGKSRSNDISNLAKNNRETAKVEEEEEEPDEKPAPAKIAKAEKTETEPAAANKVEEPAAASSATTEIAPAGKLTRTRSNTPIAVTLGLNYFTRSLRYKDDLFGELRPYTLGGAPAPVVDLVLYPAGFVMDGVPAHLGLAVHVEYALALKSKDSMDREFPTSELEFEGALRGRIPFGGHEVALSAGFGSHSFSIDNAADNTDPDVPGVSYSFLRFGLEARFAIIDALNLTLIGAYRPVLGSGEISEDAWFKRSSAGAADAGVRIAYAVVPSFDIIVGGNMRRYFYTLNPEPGDPRVAGGALDQYFSGMIAIGWHLE